MAAPRKYPDELRERAIRLAVDARKGTATRSGAIARVGGQLGINPETSRTWVTQAEIDGGTRPGRSTGPARCTPEWSAAGTGWRGAPWPGRWPPRAYGACPGPRARAPPSPGPGRRPARTWSSAVHGGGPGPAVRRGHHLGSTGQYVAVRYTQRLAEAGAVASVGSTGDSYDNALAEAFDPSSKAGPVRDKGPWKNIDDLETATAEYVDWFDHRRVHGEIGLVPPVEHEAAHHQTHPAPATVGASVQSLHRTRYETAGLAGGPGRTT